jgi:hypothetical protein
MWPYRTFALYGTGNEVEWRDLKFSHPDQPFTGRATLRLVLYQGTIAKKAQGLKCLRENHAVPLKFRRDGLRVAQDAVLGNDKRAGTVP